MLSYNILQDPFFHTTASPGYLIEINDHILVSHLYTPQVIKNILLMKYYFLTNKESVKRTVMNQGMV